MIQRPCAIEDTILLVRKLTKSYLLCIRFLAIGYLELAPISRLGSLAPRKSRVLLDSQGLEIARHRVMLKKKRGGWCLTFRVNER
jgi:hypothetical protein